MSGWRRWGIVVLLSFGMIIAYIDRANLSVALSAPEFKKHFQLSDADRGVLNSVFFWSYAFLQIPAGWLVDRFGVKIPYAIAFVFWSLTSAATAFATGVGQIMGLRFLLGIGEALVTPASMRWIRFNIPERSRGLATGIYMAGTKYGPAIGTPLAAMLMREMGWQQMFLILGLGCMVWLLPWLLMVRNDDRELEAAQAKAAAGPPMAFRDVWRTPVIYGIFWGTFCYNYFVFFSLTWLPSYLRERRGMSETDMGTIAGFSFGGMATVAILAGALADWLILRGWNAVKVRKSFTVAGLLVASTEIIGAMSDSHTVAISFAILSLSGLGLATANYWALTQTLMPGAAAGRIAGVQNMASNLSGVVAPLLTGWLLQITGSYNAAMIAIVLFLVSGALAYIVLVREKYAPGRRVLA
ncbi:MAG: MFS transporter [Acidobacteria bacterium]|nr:MFS transporter [Acidobacteriota bacterium]